MDSCTSPLAVDNQHDGEYYEIKGGEEWRRCVNCGDIYFARYHDMGSGC